MSTINFNSVKDIVDYVVSGGDAVYIRTKSKVESKFIQGELKKFGVRIGACLDMGYPKRIGVLKAADDLFSSGNRGYYSNEGNTISFEDFKVLSENNSLVNNESGVVVSGSVGDQIQDKLKVVEHYLNGGDIQFLGGEDKWYALTGSFVLSTIKTHDVRIKPKTYKFEGARLTKDEILIILGDE